MKIVQEDTLRRVREVLGSSSQRAWRPAKLPPATIAFVPFTLAEVELLPDDRRRADADATPAPSSVVA